MKVPFLEMEIKIAIELVLKTASLSGSCFGGQFENEFASYCGTKYAVGCGSGKDALKLALLSADVNHNDEVIIPPNINISMLAAIHWCGARPVFIDIKETDFTIDPGKIEKAITDKTKAILPVHMYGQMADMDPILSIAGK
jgi:dTDP-4-amino-4,6-dideoxygalactose transaminase